MLEQISFSAFFFIITCHNTQYAMAKRMGKRRKKSQKKKIRSNAMKELRHLPYLMSNHLFGLIFSLFFNSNAFSLFSSMCVCVYLRNQNVCSCTFSAVSEDFFVILSRKRSDGNIAGRETT